MCENGLSDAGHPSPWGLCKDCKSAQEINARYNEEMGKLDKLVA